MALIRSDIEYFMVPAIQSNPKALAVESLHHKAARLNGSMTVDIQLMEEPFRSPLYVGTGDYEVDIGGLYQPFARRGEQLVIPGAGIKGVVRAYAEALSPSCEGGRCKGNNLCPCCALFGMLSFQGRVTFCDTEPVDAKRLTLSKPSILLRWGGRLTDGRRFYWHSDYNAWIAQGGEEGERVEVVEPPATFSYECFFRNVTEEELGLLFLAMGTAPGKEFPLKLGGGKNRGLGSLWFKVRGGTITLTPESNYRIFQYQPETKSLTDWGKDIVEKYLASLKQEQKLSVEENIGHFKGARQTITAEQIRENFKRRRQEKEEAQRQRRSRQ